MKTRLEIPFRLPSLNQEKWKYIKNSSEYEISSAKKDWNR